MCKNAYDRFNQHPSRFGNVYKYLSCVLYIGVSLCVVAVGRRRYAYTSTTTEPKRCAQLRRCLVHTYASETAGISYFNCPLLLILFYAVLVDVCACIFVIGVVRMWSFHDSTAHLLLLYICICILCIWIVPHYQVCHFSVNSV